VGGAPPTLGSVDAATRQIDESRNSALYRLIGYYVMFHNLASRVRSAINRILPVINVAGGPVFLLIALLSVGHWRIRFRPWDIAETQSRANIFTTSVAPPIDLPPYAYRPLLWKPLAASQEGRDESDPFLSSHATNIRFLLYPAPNLIRDNKDPLKAWMGSTELNDESVRVLS
jgi:hypothetical protein